MNNKNKEKSPKYQWLDNLLASGLTPATKVFAIGIFQHMYGEDNVTAWPGTTTLQKETGLSRSKFSNYRKELFECGALTGSKERQSPGKQENYTYALNLDWDGTHRERVPSHDEDVPTGDIDVPTGDVGGTQRGHRYTPEGALITEVITKGSTEGIKEGETETDNLPLKSMTPDPLCSVKDDRSSLKRFNKAPGLILKKREENSVIHRQAMNILGDDVEARLLFDDPTFIPNEKDEIIRATKARWRVEAGALT